MLKRFKIRPKSLWKWTKIEKMIQRLWFRGAKLKGDGLKRSLFGTTEELEENCIRYIGIYIDSNISWKSHINYIAKKIKRSVGILSRLCYFLNTKTLLSLYYTLVELFFNYCVIAWGNAYQSTLQPLSNLQKKAIRIITFSSFTEHPRPLFKDLNIVKLADIITFQLAVFMQTCPIYINGYDSSNRWSIVTNGTIGTNRNWCYSNDSIGEYASH